MTVSLEQFGEIYESRGVKYFRIPLTPKTYFDRKSETIKPVEAKPIGIRVDRIRAYAGAVESFDKIQESEWYAIKVSGLDRLMVIHQRWVDKNGYLQPGDQIEGVLLVNTTGYDVPLPDVYASWSSRKVKLA